MADFAALFRSAIRASATSFSASSGYNVMTSVAGSNSAPVTGQVRPLAIWRTASVETHAPEVRMTQNLLVPFMSRNVTGHWKRAPW